MKTVQFLPKSIILMLLVAVSPIQFILGQTVGWMTPSLPHRYRMASQLNHDIIFDLGNTNFAGINTNRSYFLMQKELRLSNGLLSSNSGNLRLRTGTNERMRIMSNNGFVGLNATNPVHNLQIHSTNIYEAPGQGIVGGGWMPGINYGVASRISLTNTLTGQAANNGGLIMQAENDMHIMNQASGNLTISASGTAIRLQGGNTYFSEGHPTQSSIAKVNILGQQKNGLRVRVSGSDK